jgi:hypothetical protein
MGLQAMGADKFGWAALELVGQVQGSLVDHFRVSMVSVPKVQPEVLSHAMSDIAETIHMLCGHVGWDMFDFTTISGEIQTPQELFGWWFSGWVRNVVCVDNVVQLVK